MASEPESRPPATDALPAVGLLLAALVKRSRSLLILDAELLAVQHGAQILTKRSADGAGVLLTYLAADRNGEVST